MNKIKIYNFLKQQILMMILLSLIPGLVYIFLGWLNSNIYPALFWYMFVFLASFFGWKIYRSNLLLMNSLELEKWYKKASIFFYIIFLLWTVIFVLYAWDVDDNLHYITIFTQIGAAVVASTILVSDRKLFFPILLIMMVPLIVYFALIGEVYSYVLTIFSIIFLAVLLYSSSTSYRLIQENYYQAQHDSLTGLYNRGYFVEYLDQATKRIRNSNKAISLILIDLDHFKTINDTLGHDIGDKILTSISKRLTRFFPPEYVVSRLGGDEFIILSSEFENYEEFEKEIYESAKKLLSLLKEPYLIDNHNLYISASIGVNIIDEKDVKLNKNFIKEADIAMYEVKAQGRDGIILFNDTLAKRVEEHLEIERRLYFALDNNELELYFQPQFNSSLSIVGAEVLVRWKSSEMGIISPSKFIHIAEQTGLIIDIGNYIMEESFKTLKEWSNRGYRIDQFSINISVRQFFHLSFSGKVKKLINLYLDDTLRDKIVFEVTETFLIKDMNKIVSVMNELKDYGISFSMDDFGTGYSSLSSLRDLPISELKIDKSFVSHLGEQISDELMINTIFSLAKIFNLKVVAEGVETKRQFDFLLKNSCDIYQGYYFSKALKKEQFESFYNKLDKLDIEDRKKILLNNS